MVATIDRMENNTTHTSKAIIFLLVIAAFAWPQGAYAQQVMVEPISVRVQAADTHINQNNDAESEITLKCTTDDGTPAASLVIDLKNKTMKWGKMPLEYFITNVTDRYISAYAKIAKNGEEWGVGGETWVFNRITGKYIRAEIGMFCLSEKDCASPRLDTAIYKGTCLKGVL